ncbi:uncharacterized protein LOC101895966 [Musca domestica]|uniref:Uncharacterized protein LOC101895966 n=1 Tax=Musca domestica TaxID=7370 RepID=A0A1I8N560_MUSDO|nr:uncharacterized protein LOC101895966 [Musca domestica]
MNRIFFYAIICSLCFELALGQQHLRYFKSYDHPGKCVFGDLVLSPGEEGQPKGSCLRLVCQQRDGLGTLKLCNNGSAVKPRCRLGALINPNGVYPACCERQVICD